MTEHLMGIREYKCSERLAMHVNAHGTVDSFPSGRTIFLYIRFLLFS